MLTQLFDDQLLLGLAQAVIAAISVLLVILLARWREIHLEKETIIAMVRGIVQVVAVGSVLLLLFNQPTWVSPFALVAMIVAAGFMGANRVKEIPGAFWISLWSIGLGAGLIIVVMIVLGVIAWETRDVIPVGSMIIANAMNTAALALDRFKGEVLSHVGEIETALALGAHPKRTVRRYVQAATEASLIPRVNSLRSLGIVWIPGLMTGMVLSGTDPVYAAIYQFVVIAMLFAAGGLASVLSMFFARSRIFTPAMQLRLRPESADAG
jgi:putative ABC transport system permease protein